ncbi:HDOD domain-containing protein [Comamonas jiangduensis]|uniref:HDOD domain-containing protein n=1 Tax=Comamonas jiangduensis TaxID=1194168 RepID=UPI003BF8D033
MSDAPPEKSTHRDNRELHMRLLADLAQDLSGDINFPTSLDLALRMRGVLTQPNITLDGFTRAVYLEPVIASRLIRLANVQEGDAATHEKRTLAATLKHAIEALGLEQARSVSLGLAMDQIMKAEDLKPFSRYADLTWEHSIRTALLAKAIAIHVGKHLDAESAMLAGLVHDIGIYYLFYRASQYEEYRNDHQALIELVLGWHEPISENVLNALGLPTVIVEAVHEHDAPRELDRNPHNLNEVIYIANLLAGSNWEWLPESWTPEQHEAMERTRQRFAFLLPEVEDRMRMMHAALR